jgi:hypothetical protein
VGFQRKVNRLNYDTGEIIETFNSVSEANSKFNLRKSDIWYSIKTQNGLIPSKKLRFEYAEERIYKTKRRIRQLDYDTGELIEIYENIETAALDNWVSFKALENAMKCRNGYMTASKLRFEYV